MRCANCGRFVGNHEEMFKRRIVTGYSNHNIFQNDRLVCKSCLQEVDEKITTFGMLKVLYFIVVLIVIGGIALSIYTTRQRITHTEISTPETDKLYGRPQKK